jgi:hypothetical protein
VAPNLVVAASQDTEADGVDKVRYLDAASPRRTGDIGGGTPIKVSGTQTSVDCGIPTLCPPSQIRKGCAGLLRVP